MGQLSHVAQHHPALRRRVTKRAPFALTFVIGFRSAPDFLAVTTKSRSSAAPAQARMPLKEFVRAVIDERSALFVGAGECQGSGLPSWVELGNFLAKDIGILPHGELDPTG